VKPSKKNETTRIETPRPAIPRPTRQVPDDEAKTRFFVVPSKRLDETSQHAEALQADEIHEVEEAPRRSRNSFPEPPRNRPRVFDRPAQAEVTTLRPSLRDERTELRPLTHEPIESRVEARPARTEQSVVVAPEIPQPIPTRSSIPPASYSVPAIETTIEIPNFQRMSTMRIAALSFVAVLAPFLCVVALLGNADPPVSRASAAAPPAVAQAVALITESTQAPTPVVAPAPVAPTPAPEPKRPPPVVVAAYHAPVAPPPPPAATAPFAGAIAPAAVQRPIARAAAASPKPKKAVASELPDAQAADALARAQLEASLR
jgi:hypothetical protein